MAEWIVEIGDGTPHIKSMIELVRCKDCRYMDDAVKNFGWDGMCNYGGKQECTMYNRFCSDGERRREVTG